MKMPDSEYNEICRKVDAGFYSRDALQALYDRIVSAYDDGREIVRRIDSLHNRKYSGMDLH
jgi:hypothetical protein